MQEIHTFLSLIDYDEAVKVAGERGGTVSVSPESGNVIIDLGVRPMSQQEQANWDFQRSHDMGSSGE